MNLSALLMRPNTKSSRNRVIQKGQKGFLAISSSCLLATRDANKEQLKAASFADRVAGTFEVTKFCLLCETFSSKCPWMKALEELSSPKCSSGSLSRQRLPWLPQK
jgi:hypothetical protein